MISRERIINAAIPVFAERGRHGAHVEEIARSGHLNKAMIYYIFHSKDELYYEVIKIVLEEMLKSLAPVQEYLAQADPLNTEALFLLLSDAVKSFSNNPYYSVILIDCLSNGSDEAILAAVHIQQKSKENSIALSVKKCFEKWRTESIVRDIDPDHLLVSIIGMFIAGILPGFLFESLGVKITDRNSFMDSRHESIKEILFNGAFIAKNDKEIKNMELVFTAVPG